MNKLKRFKINNVKVYQINYFAKTLHNIDNVLSLE